MPKLNPDIKLIADVNIEKYIIDKLIEDGIDVISVINVDKYMSDVEVLKLANNEQRVLLTNDKDFGEIVYRQKLIAYGIILLRFKEQKEKDKYKALIEYLKSGWGGIQKKFAVISKEKIRSISL